MPQAAPKRGENSVGAALCGRPGRGACSGPTTPPTQGGHIGPPLHAPSLFQNRGQPGGQPLLFLAPAGGAGIKPGASTPGRGAHPRSQALKGRRQPMDRAELPASLRVRIPIESPAMEGKRLLHSITLKNLLSYGSEGMTLDLEPLN